MCAVLLRQVIGQAWDSVPVPARESRELDERGKHARLPRAPSSLRVGSPRGNATGCAFTVCWRTAIPVPGEPNKGAQHKIVHVIAMTASKCAFAKSEAAAGPARFVLGEAWPALMDAFQTLVRSPTAEQRLLGLFLAQTLL
ncbi:unnamed protein product, partial [Symbiodinium sp. KB8]